MVAGPVGFPQPESCTHTIITSHESFAYGLLIDFGYPRAFLLFGTTETIPPRVTPSHAYSVFLVASFLLAHLFFFFFFFIFTFFVFLFLPLPPFFFIAVPWWSCPDHEPLPPITTAVVLSGTRLDDGQPYLASSRMLMRLPRPHGVTGDLEKVRAARRTRWWKATMCRHTKEKIEGRVMDRLGLSPK